MPEIKDAREVYSVIAKLYQIKYQMYIAIVKKSTQTDDRPTSHLSKFTSIIAITGDQSNI